MALLNLRTRQKYLKELGFYTGEVDGIFGSKTLEAVKLIKPYKKLILQKKLDLKIGMVSTDLILINF